MGTLKFEPSEYQNNVFDFILNGSGNAVISAVAGSGKTTTLLEVLKLISKDKSVLFLAFNKNISDELKGKVPKNDNTVVQTVHAFGYASLMNHGICESIDNHKYNKILRNILDHGTGKKKGSISEYKFDTKHGTYVKQIIKNLKKIKEDEMNDYIKNVVKLCNLGRLNLVDFDIKSIGINEIKDISNQHSIDHESGEASTAWYLIKLGLYYKSVIDYTDMIVLPIVLDLEMKVYDFVFIDECQDLNTSQRTLMTKSINPDSGRFIAVGDPKQAIYGFAGADHESYMKLKTIPDTIELPLSITYRCAKQIVDEVIEINPDIEHSPENTKGEVLRSFSYKDIRDGDMVLCRQTFPIVSLCIKLLSEGKKSFIIGSDIGKSIGNLISSCERSTEDFTMENVFNRLYHDRDVLVTKIMENYKLSKAESLQHTQVILLNEKIQIIEVLSMGITDPLDVIRKINDIFSDNNKVGICLSNIHKSKGLEAERVFIIHEELMPSKYAKTDQELEQEENLRYVAYTRAKTTLGFVTDFDAWKHHESKSKTVKKVTNSKHVGSVGMKMKLQLKITGVRDFVGKFGPTVVYEMVDDKGNVFSKFGRIDEDYLLTEEEEVDVNSKVKFYGKITNHSEFKGVKITRVGAIMKH